MDNPSLSLKDTGRIYLDHNATTAPLLSVVSNLAGWASHWGNPSSIHKSGRVPKNILRETRQAVAQWVGASSPLEIIFTSSGSESNNYVIKGFFEHNKDSERNEYITTRVEHPSVLKSFRELELRGARVHYLDVNREGHLSENQYKSILSEKTALVSVMLANNETGTIFPVKKMSELAREVGARFHTDAVQALGKISVNVHELGVDFATFVGHKVHALKGAGFVYSKKGGVLRPLISGGGQERGRRSGTENVLALASLGHVARELAGYVSERGRRVGELRDFMEFEILRRLPGVKITGAEGSRLPNTSSLLIDDVDGESLLMSLDLRGVSVSTGAACSSGSMEPSHVLLAMGLSRVEAQKSLRVSLGMDTTSEELEKFLKILEEVVLRLRRLREGESHAEL